MNAELERIKSIKSFPSLVKYLREELEWKIDDADIEDLTFDYDAAELGIDKETAVKIKEIKQLRPLVSNQPWGIFYLSFEPKRLPIVALRRILRSLVIKKRESANRSQMATWEQNDLLFISSYGEQDNRELTFAHFSESEGTSGLPTLKVLGWSSSNSLLRLQDTYETLKEKLHWPNDENNFESWRLQWSSAFKLQYRQTIKTSKELAIRLADLASVIRNRVNEVLATEIETGPWRRLFEAFRKVLIHNLTPDDFADMYAQTICYGLLSTQISRASGALVPEDLVAMIPPTNPFLREMMQTFVDLSKRGEKIDLEEAGISEVIDLLANADMDQIKLDFDAGNRDDDPVIHFYESFLKEYDAEKKAKRGVFYTPKPVVRFIVQSVHEILRKDFGLEDGLADTTTWGEMKRRYPQLQLPAHVLPDLPFVQILDPATGTGTFLIEVIDLIYETLHSKWSAERKNQTQIDELWTHYVQKHLLTRIWGFELMMAPYAIAHMKISLKLTATRCYMSQISARAQIYLTNTLEEPKDFPLIESVMPALAHEAEAANRVKRHAPITVIIGNPPYSSSISEGPWIMDLIADYKEGLNETKSDLNREEWKFIRYSQDRIEKSLAGVNGFVINRSFLDGVTHRRMRESLQETFSDRRIIDLHGDVKGETVESEFGGDQNVFEIEQGVCISILTRTIANEENTHKYYSLSGPREYKYQKLLGDWSSFSHDEQTLRPAPEYFFWTPFSGDTSSEYESGIKLSSLFKSYSSGIQTKRDKLTVHFHVDDLENAVNDTLEKSRDYLIEKYGLAPDGRDWKLNLAKDDLKSSKGSRENIKQILYKPFDLQWTYYTGKTRGFLAYPRREVMQHIVDRRNLGLIFNRQIVGSSISHFFVTRNINLHGTFYLGNKGQDYLAPLYLYPTEEEKRFGLTERTSNFSDGFIETFSDKLGMKFVSSGETADIGTDTTTFTPEDVFTYAYALFHSPEYRSRYTEFLKIDFPRLPLTTDTGLFRELGALGSELAALHLLEGVDAPKDWNLITDGSTLYQIADVASGFPKYEDGKVFINRTAWFVGVEEEVWNFHIGGYQVCHKWLKDRKGRTLSPEDIAHYGKITVSLRETIRLMAEIDEVIDAHGGFPLVGSGKT